MPAWVKDDDIWARAKKQVKKTWDTHDDPWAVVATIYKQMGGRMAKGEASSASAQGALMRPQEAARRGWTYESLQEAKVNRGKRDVECILITEGPGNQVDRNYYTAPFIQDVVVKYEGARAYLNHATQQERATRSEGDIRTLCGFYHGLKAVHVMDPKTGLQVLAAQGFLHCDESDAGNDAMAKAEAQIEYRKLFPQSKEEYCGLSINGSGIKEGTVNIAGADWNKITGVGEPDSVDVVTRPARGGAFLALVESAGSAPTLSTGDDMKIRKIMAITAELAEANKKLNSATEDSVRESLQAEIKTLTSRLKEAAKPAGPSAGKGEPDGDEEDEAEEARKKKEAEGEESEEDESEEAEEESEEAMGKLVPKKEDESEEAYKARMAKVKAAFKPKKGKESVQGMSADDLRRKHPRLFEAVASRVRSSEASKSTDLATVKEANKTLVRENRDLTMRLTVLEDTAEAEKLLTAAKLPSRILKVADLIGLTTEEKKREVEKAQALLEAVGGGRPYQPASGARGGAAKGGLMSSIEALKVKQGGADDEE